MEDNNATKRSVEAGKLLSIEGLDHLVVNSDNSFTSLKERGIFKRENNSLFSSRCIGYNCFE
ncbi:JAB domain-containing protein [Enterococcus faecium]|uniref:JAB domain-containing protein n=1 Tax=Enterococcus faecium TaxID=1352 RepID=UPI0021AEB76C|nr:JAB domain-containing protein [Enterococcus faecium]